MVHHLGSSNGSHLRRIRNIWLRCIFSPSWLVSTRMARELAPCPHHSEGTIAHSHSSSTLGKPVEGQVHMFQVGQHGSSRHPQEQDIQGPATHAPSALFGVLCSFL